MTASGGVLAPAPPRVVGELVAPLEETVETFASTLGLDSPTAKTYTGACERFALWVVDAVGPTAGPEHVTLAHIAAYEKAMKARGLAESTIRKDRSAVNRFVRFLAEHELIEPAQARLALARRLPSAPKGEREQPKCLTDEQYRRLLTEAEAAISRDPLRGWRNVAIIRLLGDAGLRVEELLALDRHDFRPKRKGARLRAIRVRRGKGNRQRSIELTPAATKALLHWDELRLELGPPPGFEGLPPAQWPMFVTLGRRRRDGSYTRLGARPRRATVEKLLVVLGRRAGVPEDLRHPHALRHTFATRFYRRTGRLAELQRLLGHSDPSSTLIYVDDDPAERERLVLMTVGDEATLDNDRRAAITVS